MIFVKKSFLFLIFFLFFGNFCGGFIEFVWALPDDTCEVSFKRFEQKIFEYFSLEEAISFQEVDDGISKSFGDLLKRFRLFDLVSHGLYGQLEMTNIWGSKNLLFSEDDIPLKGEDLYIPRSNEFDLNSFPTNNIDTLKIIEGGVANIFCNRAGIGCIKIKGKDYEEGKPYSKAWFQRGSDHYRHTRIELGRGIFSLGKVYLTGEFRKYGGNLPNSDIDSRYFTCKSSFRLKNNLKLNFDALHYNTDVGIPNPDEDLISRKEQSDWRLNLRTFFQPKENHLFTIDLFYSPKIQKLKNIRSLKKEQKKEKSFSFKVSQESDFSAHHFLFTGYLGKEKLKQSSFHSAWEGYFSGADLFRVHPKVNFLMFLKYHKLEDFRKRFQALGGLSYSPTFNLTLFGTAGKFYRFPSLFDLYSTSEEENYSNFEKLDELNIEKIVQRKNLKEQSSSEFNFGAKWVKDNYKVKLGFVQTEIEDDILWIGQSPENFDREISGFYLSSSFIPHPDFSFFASYSYKDVKYKENGKEYFFPSIPISSAFSFIQYKKEFLKKEIELKLRVEGEYLSERYLDYQELDKVSDVFIVNSKITVTLLDLHLYGVVNNITDQEYKLKGEYFMPQREILLGFFWEFWD